MMRDLAHARARRSISASRASTCRPTAWCCRPSRTRSCTCSQRRHATASSRPTSAAAGASRRPGSIALRLGVVGNRLASPVEDDGRGIDAQVAERPCGTRPAHGRRRHQRARRGADRSVFQPGFSTSRDGHRPVGPRHGPVGRASRPSPASRARCSSAPVGAGTALLRARCRCRCPRTGCCYRRLRRPDVRRADARLERCCASSRESSRRRPADAAALRASRCRC